MATAWEIFHVYFQPPLPFQEGQFGPEQLMMVSTTGGRKDAEVACKKFHKGCQVNRVVTSLEDLCGALKVQKVGNPSAPNKKGKKK